MQPRVWRSQGATASNRPGACLLRDKQQAGLADRVRAATDIEPERHTRLRKGADFKEGVDAVNQRRVPWFVGRQLAPSHGLRSASRPAVMASATPDASERSARRARKPG